MSDSLEMIRYKYEVGSYTVQQLIDFVKRNIISEEDFHDITALSYSGMTK